MCVYVLSVYSSTSMCKTILIVLDVLYDGYFNNIDERGKERERVQVVQRVKGKRLVMKEVLTERSRKHLSPQSHPPSRCPFVGSFRSIPFDCFTTTSSANDAKKQKKRQKKDRRDVANPKQNITYPNLQ